MQRYRESRQEQQDWYRDNKIKKREGIRMTILRCVWKVVFVIEMILNVEVKEGVDYPPSDSVDIRNGTLVGTSHLDPR